MPVPEQMALVAVAGTTMNDVWAIARDTILRWNGTEWKRVYEHVDPSPQFYGIWVAKPDDVWVLRTGVIVRYSSQNGGAPAFPKVHRCLPQQSARSQRLLGELGVQ